MSFEDHFASFRDVKETADVLFTIVIHDLSSKEAIEAVDHRLQLAREMRQSKKKSIACQRLHDFRESLILLELDLQLNAIFLIDDQVHEIPLTSEWKQVLKDYQIENFHFK